MGIFRKQVYKKDSKGKWQVVKDTIVECPHDVGRWGRTIDLEKKNSNEGRTWLVVAPTKSGMNKKVTKAVSYFGSDEKYVRSLITTSNKLSKRDYEKYKNVKDAKLYRGDR